MIQVLEQQKKQLKMAKDNNICHSDSKKKNNNHVENNIRNGRNHVMNARWEQSGASLQVAGWLELS